MKESGHLGHEYEPIVEKYKSHRSEEGEIHFDQVSSISRLLVFEKLDPSACEIYHVQIITPSALASLELSQRLEHGPQSVSKVTIGTLPPLSVLWI